MSRARKSAQREQMKAEEFVVQHKAFHAVEKDKLTAAHFNVARNPRFSRLQAVMCENFRLKFLDKARLCREHRGAVDCSMRQWTAMVKEVQEDCGRDKWENAQEREHGINIWRLIIEAEEIRAEGAAAAAADGYGDVFVARNGRRTLHIGRSVPLQGEPPGAPAHFSTFLVFYKTRAEAIEAEPTAIVAVETCNDVVAIIYYELAKCFRRFLAVRETADRVLPARSLEQYMHMSGRLDDTQKLMLDVEHREDCYKLLFKWFDGQCNDLMREVLDTGRTPVASVLPPPPAARANPPRALSAPPPPERATHAEHRDEGRESDPTRPAPGARTPFFPP